jgi:hypothetical protein
MTKRVHPAARARTLTGATSFLALVGIVSGFQFAANAEDATSAGGTATPSGTVVKQPVDPATGQPIVPATEPVAEAVPAPASDAPANDAPVAAAPAPVAAPAAAPAPAPVVAPAPAPVSGTTAGSGG